MSLNASNALAVENATKVLIQDIQELTDQENSTEIEITLARPEVPLWGLTGHLDTPYAIALLAGRSEKEAQLISYYSEYPDEFKEFNATGQFTTLNFKWRKLIYTKLHSLYSGDHYAIVKRRYSIGGAIEESLKNRTEIWKTGILIHSLGDSYAHTKGKYNSKD